MVTNPPPIPYFLSLEADTLPLFHNLRSSSEGRADDPYGPLIKCLSMQDEFVLLESLRIMALLIS